MPVAFEGRRWVMGGTAAIEHNRQALKRILAAIVAMAGLLLEPILPRRLYLAVLRLLRPAESATRRLIIAMARGLAVTLPPRPRKAAHKIKVLPLIVRDGFGTGIVLPSGAPIPASLAHLISPAPKRCLRTLALTDAPLRWRARRRPAAAASIPRIAVPGVTTIFAASARKPPAPDDAIDASRLVQRLEVLRRALDDLPGQARRLALWRARQGRSRGQGRFRRLSPLRPGRPPGGRLSRYDPFTTRPPNIREVDEVLAHAHALAIYALEHPDTS